MIGFCGFFYLTLFDDFAQLQNVLDYRNFDNLNIYHFSLMHDFGAQEYISS